MLLLSQCNNYKRQLGSWRVQQQGSNEFVSEVAGGMKEKIIVEVIHFPLVDCKNESHARVGGLEDYVRRKK